MVYIGSYDYSYTVPGTVEGEYVTKKGHRSEEKTFLKEDYKMIEYPSECNYSNIV